MTPPNVRTPFFPLYSMVRPLLKVWQGVKKSAALEMQKAIEKQQGTPQNPVDWSEPDTWIESRLEGEPRELARKLWQDSGKKVNPRHVYGAYVFLNSYALLVPDAGGRYQLSARGQGFQDGDPETLRLLDHEEGLLELLTQLSGHIEAKRGELLGEWGVFLKAHSKYGSPSTHSDTLYHRLTNLLERTLISRSGVYYRITEAGLRYVGTPLKTARGEGVGVADPRVSLLAQVREYNTLQREALQERLSKMNPYAFEHLIKDLLEAMGYADVQVTKQSGDKGVDVVGTVQFGITTLREVVQVKRHQGNITRPVIDQLRGALPYHAALRGTIITVGKFAKGIESAALFVGAAPITLIDGAKLVELLFEHGIGVGRRTLELFEIDESRFVTPETALELEG